MIGPSSGSLASSALTLSAISPPVTTPVPVGITPIGMGGSAENVCRNGSASGGPSSGIARISWTTGSSTAAGLSDTGVPGAPCTVVAQLPTTTGSAATAAPDPAAAPAAPTANTTAPALSSRVSRVRMSGLLAVPGPESGPCEHGYLLASNERRC